MTTDEPTRKHLYKPPNLFEIKQLNITWSNFKRRWHARCSNRQSVCCPLRAIIGGGSMQDIRVWPHLVVIAIVVAVLAGAGVLLWTKHRAGVDDTTRIAAARLDRVEGDVGVSQPSAGDAANASKSQWTAARTNMPVSVGDRIVARENAHAS